MARLIDEGVLRAYRLNSGSLYHVPCGEIAQYRQGATQDDDRWTCTKCDSNTSPWTTDFTIFRTRERGVMPVKLAWVLLLHEEMRDEIYKLDTHQATLDEFQNTYTYLRPASDAEKCQWWHKSLLEVEKKEKG